MTHKYKAGDKVRVLDAPTLRGRSDWAGKEVTLKAHDVGGESWEAGWSVEEKECPYRFRESELALSGPIRTETVTTRRIEPGVYGRLQVAGAAVGGRVHVLFDAIGTSRGLDASELRELARVALEIAEYLDAQ